MTSKSKTKPPAKTSSKAEAPFAVPDWPAMPTLWKISAVFPYEHNARTHPPAQIDLLAALLTKYGPDQPIVVDENKIILKGHGRRLGAMKAGLEYFPVVQRFGLSDDDKRAMRIADNQVALLAGWDEQLVGFEVKVLERNGFDVKLLGFGDKQLVSFTTALKPPGAFQQFDENIPVEYCCPNCKYSWSGNPMAGKTDDKSKDVPVRVRKTTSGKGEAEQSIPGGSLLAGKKKAGEGKAGKHKS